LRSTGFGCGSDIYVGNSAIPKVMIVLYIGLGSSQTERTTCII